MIFESFVKLYEQLNSNNIELLDDVYAENILFKDPFHQIEGLQALKEYFNDLYQNVISVSFDFSAPTQQKDVIWVQWIMCLQHPKLNSGNRVTVNGATMLKVGETGKIVYHHDYFDAGEMFYEQLPLLGFFIKRIKRNI